MPEAEQESNQPIPDKSNVSCDVVLVRGWVVNILPLHRSPGFIRRRASAIFGVFIAVRMSWLTANKRAKGATPHVTTARGHSRGRGARGLAVGCGASRDVRVFWCCSRQVVTSSTCVGGPRRRLTLGESVTSGTDLGFRFFLVFIADAIMSQWLPVYADPVVRRLKFLSFPLSEEDHKGQLFT